MKKFLLAFFVSVGILFFPQDLFAQTTEEIRSFHSDIVVHQDTSITISEEIDYTTTLRKHGIYRYIPITYNKDGIKTALRVTDISVTDADGEDIQYERTTDSKFTTLKIGDPDRTFTGDKTYHISYRVEHALTQFENHTELYWDITGEGWKVPIASSSATVTSPFAEITEVACFSGPVGGNNQLCEASYEGESATFTYPKPVLYGHNFTIAVKFPLQSQLVFPTETEQLLSWLRYNWAVFLIPLPLLLILVLWNKNGRDIQFVSPNVFDLSEGRPTQRRPLSLFAREPFVYQPLSDLSPGEAGALIDEKVDIQDVVSEILELVRKKYIKIELIEKKKFLHTARDYQFTKLKSEDPTLPPVQLFLHSQLFLKKSVVTVSQLKGTFYTSMSAAQALLEKSLVDKNIYVQKPSTARAKGIGMYVLAVVAVAAVCIIQFSPLGISWPVSLVLLQVPVGLFVGYNMTQKTAVGTNLWLQARGLRKSIKYGKWREEIKEKKLFIEEVLPFAVALGVVDRLSKDMKDLNIQPPDYLHTAGLTSLSTQDFVKGFSQEVGSSLSYNPSSSSSSGSSGFSSGGGFSGGGGGGGGGGSW